MSIETLENNLNEMVNSIREQVESLVGPIQYDPTERSNMNNESEVNYISYDDATELVDRIATRASNFNYSMTDNEKEAMAQLLSDIGVNTSDLINVANLADNYAINAEIVSPDDAKHYDNLEDDSLFSWEEDDGTYYCYQW